MKIVNLLFGIAIAILAVIVVVGLAFDLSDGRLLSDVPPTIPQPQLAQVIASTVIPPTATPPNVNKATLNSVNVTSAVSPIPLVPTPSPVVTQTAEDQVRAMLGASNRDVPRLKTFLEDSYGVMVEWSINDNLFEWAIYDSAEQDAVDILAVLQSAGKANRDVILNGTFAMRDQFGNSSESVAVHLVFTPTTIQRINWADNDFVRLLLHDSIYDIADRADIHAEFRN